jgi:hypothetical protein
MESSAQHPPPIDASQLPQHKGGGSDAPSSTAPWGSPAAADEAAAPDAFAERPELFVGAAFAGGVALAGLLRFLGR